MMLTEYDEKATLEYIGQERYDDGRKDQKEEDDLKHIQNLMQSTGWSVQKSMDNLQIDPDKRSDYEAIITGKKPAMA